jgi:putative hydrolase of the HAD superfamily
MKCLSQQGERRPVVVFDIDDTLYLESDYARSGFHAAGDWLEERYGYTNFAAECLRLFDEGVRGSIFNAALAKYLDGEQATLIGELVSVYRRHAPSIVMLPDAANLIEALRDRVFFAAISDGPIEAQQQKAKALALRELGIVPILTDRWGKAFWKPSPRAYAVVERIFGSRATSFCYIADNPVKDFVAPSARGWRCIRIRRPGSLHFTSASRAGEVDVEAPSMNHGCPFALIGMTV